MTLARSACPAALSLAFLSARRGIHCRLVSCVRLLQLIAPVQVVDDRLPGRLLLRCVDDGLVLCPESSRACVALPASSKRDENPGVTSSIAWSAGP